MDDDVRFALRFRANEYGIFDEDLIQRLFVIFEQNQFNDIEELITKSFDTNILNNQDDYIEYSIDSNAHIQNIQELDSYRYIRTEGLINVTQQNQARRQYNQRYPIIQNNIQPNNVAFQQLGPFAQLIGDLQNMFNMVPINNIMGGGLNPYAPVRVAMTKESLDKIKKLSYEDVKKELPNLDINEKCAICWEKLSENIEELKDYRILPCKHVFHSVCIDEELENYSYHCPTCKKECGEHEAKLDDNVDEDDDIDDNDDELDDNITDHYDYMEIAD